MAKTHGKGPRFVRYFGPVVEALKELGGSGSPDEVRAVVASRLAISEQEQSEQLSSGSSRFDNQVAWARFYLTRAGLLDSSRRGIWSLTEKGRATTLSHTAALQLFKEVHQAFSVEWRARLKPGESSETLEESSAEAVVGAQAPDHREQLLTILKGLPAAGFERLCQRLLRESGFQNVTVTGRSGDGGLDGNGVVEVNPFVSFRVLFQCKRYSGAVAPAHVRDFRGAMAGRADKGIILTTGTFTAEARREAVRDGVPPIELVDGEKFLDMFEKLELGLKPRVAFEIDDGFFDAFRK
ncbi:Mrr restriction system protein [Candidatus Methylomirabilis lanthanidiphila]|uniref:Mrr restriction system protein n=1 Tax=Candidatus Methylomirabilis lanthanidiphila TaxID=2211376 RepID=A0A564ZIS0_9BACT|nr:restriction endonuclease [Candidatus Methylomirabilis lanthanidiphila]VUZ85229.1 Mrr restriction system protein [Candidatus Methylomirabilis lanthanidiphila]